MRYALISREGRVICEAFNPIDLFDMSEHIEGSYVYDYELDAIVEPCISFIFSDEFVDDDRWG